MPGEYGAVLLPRVHHKVHHEQVFHHSRRLKHVEVQGVVLCSAVPDQGIRAQPFRVQRQGVVLPYGPLAADPRQDAFAPAAEARHHVICGGAQADAQIRPHSEAVDRHLRSEGGGAQRDEILAPAVVVHHPDLLKDGVRDQFAEL